MFEGDLPPPYSPADEQQPDSTPPPPLPPKPSALRPPPPPAIVSDPGLLPPPLETAHTSNVSLPSHVSTTGPSSSAALDLSAFKPMTAKVARQLVTLEDIKTHLRLLRAFRLFKEKVEDPYSDPRVAGIVPPVGRAIGVNGRWLWFLEMAVERFRRWVMLLATAEGFFVIPPVDVWLIWNTYMLNPRWYMEDRERLWLLRPLRQLEEHPLRLAATMGDDILNYQPNGDQEGLWEAGTRLPFDPFVSSATLLDQDIECPRCTQGISVSIVNADDTGFAQGDFTSVCPRCDTLITREALAVAKFIRDIVLDPKNSTHVDMHGKGVYLPGTLLTYLGHLQTLNASKLKNTIRNLGVFRNDYAMNASPLPFQGIDAWTRAIGERLKYSSTELRKNLEKVTELGDRMVRRIMGAYVDGKPFSVELVAAAMRQSLFVDKIHELGWLGPGFLEDPESTQVLNHCILRYYGFLTLVRTDLQNTSFFVPTLDVDLVWHTHQLAPANYPKDCRSIALRLIDHDDQVEENHLGIGLDKTSKAWREQFGASYMYCGCPLEAPSLGQRILSARHHRIKPPMDREDSYAATHASDHNSVFIKGRSVAGREFRRTEWEKRREKEGKKIGKGKSAGKNVELEGRYLRGRGHDFPFSSPIPKTHEHGCPHAKQSYPSACAVGVSGCAARAALV